MQSVPEEAEPLRGRTVGFGLKRGVMGPRCRCQVASGLHAALLQVPQSRAAEVSFYALRQAKGCVKKHIKTAVPGRIVCLVGRRDAPGFP